MTCVIYTVYSLPIQSPAMKKMLAIILMLMLVSVADAQVIGRVDKKSKEFTVASNPKAEYRVFGFQYANNTTRKMICFSSRVADVKDNFNKCPLGSYFNTNEMKEGDRIVYIGGVGTFAMMNYISGSGKKTIFFLPKINFTIK